MNKPVYPLKLFRHFFFVPTENVREQKKGFGNKITTPPNSCSPSIDVKRESVTVHLYCT